MLGGCRVARSVVRDPETCRRAVAPAARLGAWCGGRGGPFDCKGGTSRARRVVSGFPSLEAAPDRPDSPGHPATMALRRGWQEGDLVLIDGHDDSHDGPQPQATA